MEKCPSYRGVRLTIARLVEVFYEKHIYVLPGPLEVSVLERCQSYGMSILKSSTVSQKCQISTKRTKIRTLSLASCVTESEAKRGNPLILKYLLSEARNGKDLATKKDFIKTPTFISMKDKV